MTDQWLIWWWTAFLTETLRCIDRDFPAAMIDLRSLDKMIRVILAH